MQESGASLIVVGAHPSGELVKDAIGSHAEGVLRSVDADVLLVREA
ncbi:universal stress protein [Bosea sp. LC85]